MTVYLRGNVYWYDFWFEGRRYRDTTKQTGLEDAKEVEENLKRQLRRRAGGLTPVRAKDSPRIQDWAEIYYEDAKERVTRPERLEDLTRCVLRFWGARPANPEKVHPDAPYRDLRLLDPVINPLLIEDFERWMASWVSGPPGTARRTPIGNQTKNQYRSCMRQMYELARHPRWRMTTGVEANPFDGLRRDRRATRRAVLSADNLRALLTVASYHVRLAVAIGALAPKLRLDNILKLQWTEHLDPDLKFLTVWEHKTTRYTGEPLVLPVSAQLRTILEDARRRSRSPYVVTYHGQPVASIRGGVRAAAERARLAYGRSTASGITFHTLRHTASTILAELDVTERKRADVLGHQNIATTQIYTHLRPMHLVAPVEQLSAALPIAELVTAPWRRASNKAMTVGTLVEAGEAKAVKPAGNQRKAGE